VEMHLPHCPRSPAPNSRLHLPAAESSSLCRACWLGSFVCLPCHRYHHWAFIISVLGSAVHLRVPGYSISFAWAASLAYTKYSGQHFPAILPLAIA